MVNVRAIKKDFPIFSTYKKSHKENLVYLDSAASSQTPKRVVDAMNEYYFNYRANIHRGPHALSIEATEAYERARATIAAFIHAEVKEIVFTPGATVGVNMLVLMLEKFLKLTPQDKLFVSASEHHSNLVPFQEWSKRCGAVLRSIPLRGVDLDYEAAINLVDVHTKIVSIPLASNVLGTIYDVRQIIQAAKKVGAITIVDATTAIGHMNIDVRSLGCDFLFFSGHKMLGPTGVGVVYGKKDMLKQLRPIFFGGGAIQSVSQEGAVFRDIPTCFEAGTPNIAGVIGLGEAAEYLRALGVEVIAQHVQDLVQYCTNSLLCIPQIQIISEREEKKNIGIVSFVVEGVASMRVTQALGTRHISSRGGYHCAMPLVKTIDTSGICRASFHVYNERADVDRLVEALKHLLNPDQTSTQNTIQKWMRYFFK